MRLMALAVIFLFRAVLGSAQILDVRELNSVEIQRLDREHTAVLLAGWNSRRTWAVSAFI